MIFNCAAGWIHSATRSRIVLIAVTLNEKRTCEETLKQDQMFSYISPEARVPQDHPLRPVRKMVDEALVGMSGRLNNLYSKIGRPSIAPEKLLRALLLQVLYSIRSERMLKML